MAASRVATEFPFWYREVDLTPAARARLHEVAGWYSGDAGAARLRQFYTLCTSESGGPSLRRFYYAVTNYVKTHPMVAMVRASGVRTDLVSVAAAYTTAMTNYTSDLFCAFRRGNFKVQYLLPRDAGAAATAPAEQVETTVGQLVFFKWAVTHGVDALVHTLNDAIREHEAHFRALKERAKAAAPLKANGKRQRVREVVPSSTRAVYGVAYGQHTVVTDPDAEVDEALAALARRRRLVDGGNGDGGGSSSAAATSLAATVSPQ